MFSRLFCAAVSHGAGKDVYLANDTASAAQSDFTVCLLLFVDAVTLGK